MFFLFKFFYSLLVLLFGNLYFLKIFILCWCNELIVFGERTRKKLRYIKCVCILFLLNLNNSCYIVYCELIEV